MGRGGGVIGGTYRSLTSLLTQETATVGRNRAHPTQPRHQAVCKTQKHTVNKRVG
jgi:hypothetical protein